MARSIQFGFQAAPENTSWDDLRQTWRLLEIRERIERFVEVGVAHFIGGLVAPFQHETLQRFSKGVIPVFRQ